MKKVLTLIMVIFSMTSCNIAQVRNTPVCSVPHADSAYKRNLPAGSEIIDLNTHKVYILTAPVPDTSTLSTTQSKTEISNNALIKTKEGNFTGYVLEGDDRSRKLNVGSHAFDMTNSIFHTDVGAAANSSSVFGIDNKIESNAQSAFAIGQNNKITGLSMNALISGENNVISDSSYVSTILGGNNNTIHNCNNSVIAGGEFNYINAGGVNYGHKAIIAGKNNTINLMAANSAIVGGNNITANNPNTVYLPVLKLQQQTSSPSNPGAGTIYYGNNGFLGYNGNEWIHLDNDNTGANLASTGLELATENGNTGWRLIGETPTIKENFTHLNNLEVNGRIDILSSVGNVFIGDKAGISNTASSNIAVGNNCLENNIDGQQNTALGYYSLKNNTHGFQNTAIGVFSLVTATGNENTGVGTRSLNNIGSGNNNTGIGSSALVNAMNSSADNTAVGANAGKWYNRVGYNLTRVSKSVFLGNGAKAKSNYSVNEIVIGNNAVGNGSNTATLGDTSITKLYAGERGTATVYKGASVYNPLTTTQRDAMTSVAEGTIIWNTTTKKLQQYSGANWEDVGGSSGSAVAPTGLETVTENGKTGWRLIGEDATNYGNTGAKAVDMSIQINGGEYGATGDYSVAVGYNNKASGFNSYAQGNHTESSGYSSHTEGGETEASGSFSHAEGYETQTTGSYSHAGGKGAGWQDEVEAAGNVTFVHQEVEAGAGTKKAEGDNSAILGGKNNATATTAKRSVVLGGIGQNAVQPDMVYVPALKLKAATAPIAPEAGTVYFDEDTNKFKGYNGSEWVTLDSVSSSTIPDAVYAEKYLDSIVQMVAANKNYTVLWAQTGEISGMAANDSSVTALSDGRYLINISGSFSMDNPSATIEGWLYKNGVKDTQTGFLLDAGANSDANGHYFRACVAANGVVNLRSGDVLTFKVKSSVSGVYRLYVGNCSITKL